MTKEKLPIDRRTWESFIDSVQRFVSSSHSGVVARWLLAVLVILLFGTNGLNVLNSYVAAAFMTAIENRDHAEFIRMAMVYVAVFAASTLVSVIYTYTEQRLGLQWRVWATRQALFSYANHRVYHGLQAKGEIGNPDQRIADDVRTFTTSTLSFLLMLLNGSFTVIAFSGVLWTISPLLFVVGVLYAAAGTCMTYLLGRPLVRLNYDQLDKEANFRSALIYLRGNAESVALSRREGGLIALSLRNLGELATNMRRIIATNRRLNFFTTWYNWLIQIIPALIVAPLFMQGHVDFGVITQAAIAFGQLVGAFSLIVREFQSLSSYAATLARLAALADASEGERVARRSTAMFTRDHDRIAYIGVTLHSPRGGRVLVENLSVQIPHGQRVLVRGRDESARVALIHATAGLMTVSAGQIARPALEQVMLVPEVPYLPPGTIRELLMLPWPEDDGDTEHNLEATQVRDERMREVLRLLGIDTLLAGFGGLDTRHHWENSLPLDAQKLLVVARVLIAQPQFVFLDRPGSTLDTTQVDWILGLLRARRISYVTFEDEDQAVSLEQYDRLLELRDGGTWAWHTVEGGRIVTERRGERPDRRRPEGHRQTAPGEPGVTVGVTEPGGARAGVFDDFADLSAWTTFASGEAQIAIERDTGPDGHALRMDFDFHGGGGFVVVRRPFARDIPESYSFSMRLRGIAPRNSFEFKLIDSSNRNVWRHRVEECDFPPEWQALVIRGSDIEFAWGPIGGGPPRDVAAIEIVIAAGPGGQGSVWIADLAFHDDTYRSTPRVTASSALPGHPPGHVIDPSPELTWRSAETLDPQSLKIDFQESREFGGLVIDWEAARGPRRFTVEVSGDAVVWKCVHRAAPEDNPRSFIYLPRTRTRHVRLALSPGAGGGRGVGIRRIEVRPHEFSRSIHHFFQHVAREQRAGLYPKYLLGRQTCWTLAGTTQGHGQALLNEEGMAEVDGGEFSVAPFLFVGGRLLTWADVALAQELADGYLPIPSVVWRTADVVLTTTAFAGADDAPSPTLYLRYRVENTSRARRAVTLFTAILPFQVTPTWQNWRSFGGATAIGRLAFADGAVRVNDERVVVPLTRCDGFGAAAFAAGGVGEYLARGALPGQTAVADEFGYASGALRFDLGIAPAATAEVVLAIPFAAVAPALGAQPAMESEAPGMPVAASEARPGRSAVEEFTRAVGSWRAVLEAIEVDLPASAREFSDTLRTAAAHILINRAGPELHPGPRRYARAWIRDGVLMGAALLRMGVTTPLRDFIRWYATHQADDGRIPDCVDAQGREWLPEFDAYGQFIYAVMEYYRFTADRAFIVEMRPAIARAVSFMEELRNRRLTAAYTEPDKRACYGLLPESMSHEGYMAHPVHAFWDDFWALRGWRDAAALATTLGDPAEAARLTAIAEAFATDLRASLAATIVRHGIDYVPGSVEFGDFDPAATSIAVALLDQLAILPRPEIDLTFEKYLAGFRDRTRNATDWNNYSAYEIRIIGALARLGRRQEALDLARFMLADRRIPAWNQWPEISWRDPTAPSFIGDMPHTWISAEYILAIRSLFACERDAEGSLVIAAGIDPEWLAAGASVGVGNLPTWYGRLSYRLVLEDTDTLRLTIGGALQMPPGGIVVQPPLARPIRAVEINGRPLATFAPNSFTCRECPAEVVIRT